jgi:periplasmic divalent cation tolerance protein
VWRTLVLFRYNPGMRRATSFRIVLVTCGSLSEARKIARVVVSKKLAACVNIHSAPVESVYWWKGKVETGREYLLVMKTAARRVGALEAEVLRLHSYETPEFLVMEIAAGSRSYLSWLAANSLPTK